MDTAVPAATKTPLFVKMYPWESRHEWVARISFIEDHLPTYGFERALSLSMVWANMKFLGCRYPEATERLVMHYNVPETDKSRKFPANGCYVLNAEDFPDGIPLGSLPREGNDDGDTVEKEDNDSDTATQVSMLISNIRERVETEKNEDGAKSAATICPELSEICHKLVLPQVITQEDHPVSVLTASCQRANLTLSFAFKEHVDKTSKHPAVIGYQTTILINDTIIGKGDSYSTKKDAKKHACEVVIERVRNFQKSTGYAPAPVNSESVQKSEILQGDGSAATHQSVPISGVGGQLLRKMGWSEETSSQATQPFDSQRNPGRSGLGFAPQESSTLRQNVEQKLHEFANSDKDELVFSSDFSTEERKMIHMLCTQYKLHHKSHGKGDDRKLVIQKRPNAQPNPSTTEQNKYNQHYEFHHSYEQADPPQQRAYSKGRPAIQSGFFQHAVDKASRPHPYYDHRQQQQQQQYYPHQMWEGRRQ